MPNDNQNLPEGYMAIEITSNAKMAKTEGLINTDPFICSLKPLL